MEISSSQNDVGANPEEARGHVAGLPEMIFSLVFAAVFSLAKGLASADAIRLSLPEILLAFIGCYAVLSLFEAVCLPQPHRKDARHTGRGSSEGSTTPSMPELRVFLLSFFVCLLSYFLCLATYFPGVGMNDGLNILMGGMACSNQFPVLYVIFILVCRRVGLLLGSVQYGIAIYSTVQVILASLVSASIVCWARHRLHLQHLWVAFLIYFACVPLVALYAISMLKDTLFGLALAAAFPLLYELVHADGENLPKRYWLLLCLCLVSMVALRNNGKYIAVLTLLVVFLLFKNARKQVAIAAVATIATAVLCSVLTDAFSDGQMFQEAVGIPLQQMAAVVASDGEITDEQRDYLSHLMPLDQIKEKYSPGTIDPIKWPTDSTFNRGYLQTHKKAFFKTWATMLPANVGIYFKAYLRQTYWFWAPVQSGGVQVYFTIETFGNNDWLIQYCQDNGIHDQPLLPEPVNGFLRACYGHAGSFFREGVCLWIMLASALVCVRRSKRRVYLILYLPCFLLWLTIMVATPVNESFRYVSCFMYALPLFVAVPLAYGRRCSENDRQQ